MVFEPEKSLKEQSADLKKWLNSLARIPLGILSQKIRAFVDFVLLHCTIYILGRMEGYMVLAEDPLIYYHLVMLSG